MARLLFYLFIIFSPFTSYFAFSAWLRLPVVLLIILIIAFFLELLFKKKTHNFLSLKLYTEDIFLILFLITVWFSYFNGFGKIRSFNHLMAYHFAIILYFYFIKIFLQYIRISYRKIMQLILISTSLCCIIIFTDWILVNFFSVEIRNIFTTVDGKIANMDYFIRKYFKSVGGVAEEPGSMAVLLNIYAPISIFYLLKVKKYRAGIILFFFYALSLFFLTSSAGIFFPILGFLTAYSLNVIMTGRVNKSFFRVLSGVLVFMVLLTIIYSEYILFLIDEITRKITLDTNDVSASIRSKNWIIGLTQWMHAPILGKGPGYGVELLGKGYHSVFLTILSDLGVFAFSFFGLFMVFVLRKILRLRKDDRFVFLMVFVSVTSHFFIIGDFYHSPFWIFLFLVQKVHGESGLAKSVAS